MPVVTGAPWQARPPTTRRGRIDGLLNGAGGNLPGATLPSEKTLADLQIDAFEQVVDLGRGSVVSYSSASVPLAVSRVVGYSAAKAAVENVTRWLAVDLARRTKGQVRVNARMPGFFLGPKNRRLPTHDDGSLTARGTLIVNQIPFGRFGQPGELLGATHYLLADAPRFVTGTVLAVDGGFIVLSGVGPP